jgi:hypothetical protein
MDKNPIFGRWVSFGFISDFFPDCHRGCRELQGTKRAHPTPKTWSKRGEFVVKTWLTRGDQGQ